MAKELPKVCDKSPVTDDNSNCVDIFIKLLKGYEYEKCDTGTLVSIQASKQYLLHFIENQKYNLSDDTLQQLNQVVNMYECVIRQCQQQIIQGYPS